MASPNFTSPSAPRTVRATTSIPDLPTLPAGTKALILLLLFTLFSLTVLFYLTNFPPKLPRLFGSARESMSNQLKRQIPDHIAGSPSARNDKIKSSTHRVSERGCATSEPKQIQRRDTVRSMDRSIAISPLSRKTQIGAPTQLQSQIQIQTPIQFRTPGLRRRRNADTATPTIRTGKPSDGTLFAVSSGTPSTVISTETERTRRDQHNRANLFSPTTRITADPAFNDADDILSAKAIANTRTYSRTGTRTDAGPHRSSSPTTNNLKTNVHACTHSKGIGIGLGIHFPTSKDVVAEQSFLSSAALGAKQERFGARGVSTSTALSASARTWGSGSWVGLGVGDGAAGAGASASGLSSLALLDLEAGGPWTGPGLASNGGGGTDGGNDRGGDFHEYVEPFSRGRVSPYLPQWRRSGRGVRDFGSWVLYCVERTVERGAEMAICMLDVDVGGCPETGLLVKIRDEHREKGEG